MSAFIDASIRLNCLPSSEMGIEAANKCAFLVKADREAQARLAEYQKSYIDAVSLDTSVLQAATNERIRNGQMIGERVGSAGVTTLTIVSWWRGWDLPFVSLCPAPIRFIIATLASIGAVYTAKIVGGNVATLVSTPPSPIYEQAWKRTVILQERTAMSLLIIYASKELGLIDEESLNTQRLQEQITKIARWAKNRLDMLDKTWNTLAQPEDVFLQMQSNCIKI